MADRAHLERLARQLADDGKLLEAGWIGLRLAAIPLDASPAQLDAMHAAYMAGAQHLWATMMTIFDPDPAVTDADERRMGHIQTEIDTYSAKLLANLPTEGRA